MKKAIAIILVLLVGFAALYLIRNKELVIRLDETQLEASMGKSLPITKTYLWVFEVTLENPRVDLQSSATRIHAGLDVKVELGALGIGEAFEGHLMFSGGVDFDPETKEFYLINPLVEKLLVDSLPEANTEKVKEAFSEALSAYCSVNPIYELKASDARTLAAKTLLKSVVIKDKKLVLTLGI